MKHLFKRTFSFVVAAALSFSLTSAANAGENYGAIADEVSEYLCNSVESPTIGSVGGEWMILGLSRSAYSVPIGYFDLYYKNLESIVKNNSGKLSAQKYTEYSRVILALSSIGRDPAEVGGFNLINYLGDYSKVTAQGINGSAFALIALDSGAFALSEEIAAICEKYVSFILDKELPAGGFSITGFGAPDPDITGMVLQALAPHKDNSTVSAVIDRALTALSRIQNDRAGFGTLAVAETAESSAQVIIALTALNVQLSDSRFVKNGFSPLDGLMRFYLGEGQFEHIIGGGFDPMATEQALLAITAYNRYKSQETPLYDMSDVDTVDTEHNVSPDKRSPDVREVPVIYPDISFKDILGHKNYLAIKELASRGIINGMPGEVFAPDDTMTRAQFTAIVVRALGLTPNQSGAFSDVPPEQWYAPYIDAAFSYSLVSGKGADAFEPDKFITRQEAAVLVARASLLCGFETNISDMEIRNILEQFADYRYTESWAQPAVAFCYKEGIFSQADQNVEPRRYVLRGEIAQMICNMLDFAGLL